MTQNVLWTTVYQNEPIDVCNSCGNKLSLSKTDRGIIDYILNRIDSKNISGVKSLKTCQKCKFMYLLTYDSQIISKIK